MPQKFPSTSIKPDKWTDEEWESLKPRLWAYGGRTTAAPVAPQGGQQQAPIAPDVSNLPDPRELSDQDLSGLLERLQLESDFETYRPYMLERQRRDDVNASYVENAREQVGQTWRNISYFSPFAAPMAPQIQEAAEEATEYRGIGEIAAAPAAGAQTAVSLAGKAASPISQGAHDLAEGAGDVGYGHSEQYAQRTPEDESAIVSTLRGVLWTTGKMGTQMAISKGIGTLTRGGSAVSTPTLWGMIGADRYDQSKREHLKAGANEEEARNHAMWETGIELGTMGVFHAIGRPGVEAASSKLAGKAVSPFASKAVSGLAARAGKKVGSSFIRKSAPALGRVGKRSWDETVEEFFQENANLLYRDLFTDTPTGVEDFGDWAGRMAQTVATAALSTGILTTPGEAGVSITTSDADPESKVAEEAVNQALSRQGQILEFINEPSRAKFDSLPDDVKSDIGENVNELASRRAERERLAKELRTDMSKQSSSVMPPPDAEVAARQLAQSKPNEARYLASFGGKFGDQEYENLFQEPVPFRGFGELLANEFRSEKFADLRTRPQEQDLFEQEAVTPEEKKQPERLRETREKLQKGLQEGPPLADIEPRKPGLETGQKAPTKIGNVSLSSLKKLLPKDSNVEGSPDGNGWRIRLPSGDFVDAVFMDDIPVTDIAWERYKRDTGKEFSSKEAEESARRKLVRRGSLRVRTEDREYNAPYLMKLSRKHADNATVAHELVHLGRRLGLYTDSQWDFFVKRYSDKDRSVRQQEEDIAREVSRRRRVGAEVNKPKAFIDSLLGLMGIDKNYDAADAFAEQSAWDTMRRMRESGKGRKLPEDPAPEGGPAVDLRLTDGTVRPWEKGSLVGEGTPDRTIFVPPSESAAAATWWRETTGTKRAELRGGKLMLTKRNPETGEYQADKVFDYSLWPKQGMAPVGLSEKAGPGFARMLHSPGTKVESVQERGVPQQAPITEQIEEQAEEQAEARLEPWNIDTEDVRQGFRPEDVPTTHSGSFSDTTSYSIKVKEAGPQEFAKYEQTEATAPPELRNPEIPVEDVTDPAHRGIVEKLKSTPPMLLHEMATELTGQPIKLKKLKGALGRFIGDDAGMQVAIDPSAAINPHTLAAVLSHELGHVADFVPEMSLSRGGPLNRLLSLKRFMKSSLGPEYPTNKEVRDELIGLSEWWHPYDKDAASDRFRKYRESAKELYADAFSVLMVAPGEFEARAPISFETIFKGLNKKPKVMQKLLETQSLLNKDPKELSQYLNKKIMREHKDGVEVYKEAVERRRARKISVKEFFSQALNAFIDKHRQSKKIARKGRGKPWEWDEARKKEAILHGLHNPNNSVRKLIDRTQDTLITPVTNLGIDTGNIGLYLQHRRIVNERGEMANPGAETPTEARVLLNSMREDMGHDKFDAMEESIQRWHREVIWPIVEEAAEVGTYSYDIVHGALDPETGERSGGLIDNLGNYAAFVPIKHLYNDPHIRATLLKQTGTFESIADPFFGTMMKMATLARLNKINRGKGVVVGDLQSYFEGEAREAPIPRLPDGRLSSGPKEKPKPGYEYLQMLVNGERKAFEVPKSIKKSFDRMDEEFINVLAGLLQSAHYKYLHPVYVTYSPGFVYGNVFRDTSRTSNNLAAINARLRKREYERLLEEGHSKREARRLSKNKKITIGQHLKALYEALPAAHKFALGERDSDIDQMIWTGALSQRYTDPEAEIVGSTGVGELVVPGAERKTVPERMKEFTILQGNVKPLKWLGSILDMVRYGADVTEVANKLGAWRELRKRGLSEDEMAYYIDRHIGTPSYTQAGRYTPVTNSVMPYSRVYFNALDSAAELAFSPDTAAAWWFRRLVLTVPLLAAKYVEYSDDEWLDPVRKILERVPSYFKDTYWVVPWGFDAPGSDEDEWHPGFLTFPMDDTQQRINRITSNLIDAAVENEVTQTGHPDKQSALAAAFGDSVYGLLPSKHPFLDIGSVGLQMSAGQNPYDPHFGNKILTHDEYEAGGMAAANKFASWSIDQFGSLGAATKMLGATFIGNSVEPTDETTTEKRVKNFLKLSGFGRILRFSDRGLDEKLWAESNAKSKEQARFRLEYMPDSAKRLATQYHFLNDLPPWKLSKDQRIERDRVNEFYLRAYIPMSKRMKQAIEEDREDMARDIGDRLKDYAGMTIEGEIPTEWRAETRKNMVDTLAREHYTHMDPSNPMAMRLTESQRRKAYEIYEIDNGRPPSTRQEKIEALGAYRRQLKKDRQEEQMEAKQWFIDHGFANKGAVWKLIKSLPRGHTVSYRSAVRAMRNFDITELPTRENQP